MRIPYEWLKEYVEVRLSPEDLADALTLHGLEVDRVEYPWPGIITAQIVWLEPIKGSDHLSATRVTDGRREYSVVCGARNIKLHDKVPLATLGAKVGEIVIAEKKAMGVLSQGMLCSPRELGLSDDHSGIYILPKDTPIGVPLGKLLGDAVIDLDIKAHRGDLFCVTGVAREVGAFTDQQLRLPRITVKEQGTPTAELMKLEVRDATLCPRYTARVVRGVKIGPSPDWMANRLLAAGMRPINNVVDVTNYVMLELGQPLHGFDYDKVANHTIVVRRAEDGEQLTTLDGVTRTLTSEMMLVTDPAGPNVIAGIFGGARVEVDDTTTNVILEAAHWSPPNIRRTAQALGLRTESSSRFEKNPDIELTTVAVDRAAQLTVQLAGGTVAPGRLDFYPQSIQPRTIEFHLDQVEWLTGLAVTATEALAALRALGFTVKERPTHGGEVILDVTVPTWRADVEESADLVEEVARIVGFDRIPSTIPTGPLPPEYRNIWFEREEELRDILVGAGLTEALSYTLTSRAVMAKLLPRESGGAAALLGAPVPLAALPEPGKKGGAKGRSAERRELESVAERIPAITLTNPPSADLEALRLTLMSGLLTAARENGKHEGAGVWLFELGRRYLPTPELISGTGLAQERRTLGAILMAGPAASGWASAERDADFYDLKGVVETMLDALQVGAYRFTPARHPTYHPGRCAALEVLALPQGAPADSDRAVGASGTWVAVGVLGEVHPEVAEQFDLTKRAYLMELDLERLYSAVPELTLSQAILRFPAAQRDLAIIVGATTPAADVADAIRASGGELLRDVRLFDLYTGEGVPAGKKSLAWSLTYQSPERTLTDAEIEAAQTTVVVALAKRFGAELRS
jgi:phenylalanyl-tRNA synthetase beta chain